MKIEKIACGAANVFLIRENNTSVLIDTQCHLVKHDLYFFRWFSYTESHYFFCSKL